MVSQEGTKTIDQSSALDEFRGLVQQILRVLCGGIYGD